MGNAGSGKTTLARSLADRLGIAHVELDAVHHLAGWTPIDPQEFRRTVTALADEDSWVIDGNYGVVRDIVLARADTVVLLDLPKPVVMAQVIRRTLRRVASGEELWNGNREQWRDLFRPEKEENIVLWSWTQHAKHRRRYLDLITDPALGHVTVVRLRSRSEIDDWLAAAQR